MIEKIYKNAKSIKMISTSDRLKIYDFFLQNQETLYPQIRKDCLGYYGESILNSWLYDNNGCSDGEFPADILASMLKHIAELENWEPALLTKVTTEADKLIWGVPEK